MNKNKIEFYEKIHSMTMRTLFSIVAIVIIFIDLPHLIKAETGFDLFKHMLIELSFGGMVSFTWESWFQSKDKGT